MTRKQSINQIYSLTHTIDGETFKSERAMESYINQRFEDECNQERVYMELTLNDGVWLAWITNEQYFIPETREQETLVKSELNKAIYADIDDDTLCKYYVYALQHFQNDDAISIKEEQNRRIAEGKN